MEKRGFVHEKDSTFFLVNKKDSTYQRTNDHIKIIFIGKDSLLKKEQ